MRLRFLLSSLHTKGQQINPRGFSSTLWTHGIPRAPLTCGLSACPRVPALPAWERARGHPLSHPATAQPQNTTRQRIPPSPPRRPIRNCPDNCFPTRTTDFSRGKRLRHSIEKQLFKAVYRYFYPLFYPCTHPDNVLHSLICVFWNNPSGLK